MNYPRRDDGFIKWVAGSARKRLLAVLAACLAVVVVAACTAGTAGANPGGAGGQAGNSGQYLNFFPCCFWGTTWSYNPYNVNGLGIAGDFITLRLADQNFPSMTDYTPQLAQSWTAGNGKLVVHLHKGAKWQDNTPVTGKDLYDTAILDGLQGDAFWNDITDVKITDTNTVTFVLRKGEPITLAENDILANILVYPSSVYGKFATAGIAKDVKSYFSTEQTDPNKAAKLPAFKRMGDAFKNLAALKVPKLIGDGPFQLQSITNQEAKLNKWNGFWGADKIKVAGIDWSDGQNEAVYPQLLSGRTDLSSVYLPPPLLKRWTKVQNANTAVPPSFGYVLGFNSHKYPFSMTEVRQALAYVIPRQQMTEAAFGTTKNGGGVWKKVDTGISPSLEKLYLSAGQLNKLNPYPLDTGKATQLLQSKGFKKQGGQWIMPNGKPFTLTITVNSATSNQVTSDDSAAKALTAFGIKSSVDATSGAQQDADQHNGNFDIGSFSPNSNDPLGMYDSMMGPGQNFATAGTYAGKRGIGFGPTMNVPGLGNVDIVQTLNNETSAVAPGSRMKALTWDWAQLVNQQVPYIWYATKNYQFEYSTKNFTNWPPVGATGTSALWNLAGYNMTAGFSLALQQGYIVPKS